MSIPRRALGSHGGDIETLANNQMSNPFYMKKKAAREALPRKHRVIINQEPVEEDSLESITSMDEARASIEKQTSKHNSGSLLSKLGLGKTSAATGNDSTSTVDKPDSGVADHANNHSGLSASTISNEIMSSDDNKPMPLPQLLVGPALGNSPRWRSMPQEHGTSTIKFDTARASRVLSESMDTRAADLKTARRGVSVTLVMIAAVMAAAGAIGFNLLIPAMITFIVAGCVWPWPIPDKRVRKPVRLPDGLVGVSTIELREWLKASRVQAGKVDAIVIAWRRGEGRRSHTLWWTPAGVNASSHSGLESMRAWPVTVITSGDDVQFFVDDRLVTANKWLHGVDSPLGGTPAPVDVVDSQAVSDLSRALEDCGALNDGDGQSLFSSGSIVLL